MATSCDHHEIIKLIWQGLEYLLETNSKLQGEAEAEIGNVNAYVCGATMMSHTLRSLPRTVSIRPHRENAENSHRIRQSSSITEKRPKE